jgi:hypothetical protein
VETEIWPGKRQISALIFILEIKKFGRDLKNKQKVLFFLTNNLFFNHSHLKSGKHSEKRLTGCADSL